MGWKKTVLNELGTGVKYCEPHTPTTFRFLSEPFIWKHATMLCRGHESPAFSPKLVTVDSEPIGTIPLPVKGHIHPSQLIALHLASSFCALIRDFMVVLFTFGCLSYQFVLLCWTVTIKKGVLTLKPTIHQFLWLLLLECKPLLLLQEWLWCAD